ncbi:MAG: hypothetical protein Unbinned5350contig1001_7 [Prokaryotic dsDNA virus sp.]|mgnify:CR=1 FL=1|nr:MAG: hypothetical protein Unbinned5350contig1001_7 [Prokaryotic dsDNA virus sp.]|tara:strand:- start:31711 stop:32331 length:621 start_codon:yes stop_codon:yes gene_type:complete
MKKIFIVALVLIAMFQIAFSQEVSDTTYLVQVDSITFAEVNINYDNEGRESYRSYTYFDSIGIENKLFDKVVNADNQLYQYEVSVGISQRLFNQLKQTFQGFSSQNYSQVLTEKKKGNFAGEWKIRYVDTIYIVESNPNNTILRNVDDGNQRMKIMYDRNNIIKIKKIGNSTPFFEGEVCFEMRIKNGKEIWFGRTDQNALVKLYR